LLLLESWLGSCSIFDPAFRAKWEYVLCAHVLPLCCHGTSSCIQTQVTIAHALTA
jgi:hypothetical protein